MIETPEGKARLAEIYHNVGNIGMQSKEYAKSVEAYKQSLRLNPKDDETRYNLALAQKLLHDQQNQQNEDQNQDQNEDKKEDQDKQDQQQQNQDQQQQQDDKKQDKTQEQQPQQQEQMSKDNAQQMLDAFLQDEKDTQEKVKKAQAQQQQRRSSCSRRLPFGFHARRARKAAHRFPDTAWYDLSYAVHSARQKHQIPSRSPRMPSPRGARG